MIDLCSHWLVGGSGLAHSGLHNAVGSGLYTATTLDDSFTRLGHSQLTPFFVLRQAQRLAICACASNSSGVGFGGSGGGGS